ncbi:hypothetical protein PsorP6_004623 [Peronosclerospora sorghi]|uniref:Uncharacterized protein n=1 Tax=Peronosclerospora sorghi TaxID=230839 RepID=A0ACC0VNK1_9STRA|nr:hypothetical protein PsorP6_004623 [Peronosclerospora sorghi]
MFRSLHDTELWKGHRTIMMQTIGQILEKVDTLGLTTLEPDLSASLCFHKKINDLMIAWGTCQLDALLIETPSEQDMASLGGILRNLCKLFANPYYCK